MLSPHGSVTAALAAHRAAIHYRFSSIPLTFLSYTKTPATWAGCFCVVEVRGIEPLSEDSVVQFSPSADRILTFPLLHAS